MEENDVRTRISLMVMLACWCLLVPGWAQEGELRIQAVRADGMFVVAMPEGGQAQARDVFTVTRGGKRLGEAMVVTVKKGSLILMPKASFKGSPRVGDLLAFARHADVPLDDTAKWVRYKAPDGAYSILLPSLPRPSEIKTEQMTVSSGPMTRTLFSIVDREQGMMYQVTCQDYVLVKHEGQRYVDDEAQVEHFCKRFAEDGHLVIRSKTSCTVNGFSGRELEGLYQGNLTVRLRLYMVESRLYVLAAHATRAGVSSNASRFLSSFELAKKKK